MRVLLAFVVSLSIFLWATAPLLDPVAPLPYSFCKSFARWKEIMRRDYPTANRSVPGVARKCLMEDF